jgi:serine O-acetyltransferase
MITRLIRDAKGIAQAEFKGSGVRDLARAVILDAFAIITLNRIRESSRRLHVPGLNRVLRLTQMMLYGVEIGNEVELGEGVSLVHSLGTVIGGSSRVGSRVRLMGNNTIGTAKDNGCPTIEADVVVGCGARVLGPVRVGVGAVIGANAVVIEDVAPGDVVAGAPAKSIRKPSNSVLG